MEQFFKELSKKIIEKIDNTEDLMINFWGEDSHFTRFNQSKVRQNGFVSDSEIDDAIGNATKGLAGAYLSPKFLTEALVNVVSGTNLKTGKPKTPYMEFKTIF